MLLFLLFQQIGQVSAHTQCITLKILFHNHIQDGQSDGTRHWVSTKLRNLKPHTERKDYTKVIFTRPITLDCIVFCVAGKDPNCNNFHDDAKREVLHFLLQEITVI